MKPFWSRPVPTLTTETAPTTLSSMLAAMATTFEVMERVAVASTLTLSAETVLLAPMWAFTVFFAMMTLAVPPAE